MYRSKSVYLCRQSRRGQTLVEFALVSVLFITLVMVTIQVGFLIFTMSKVKDVTRKTARYAAIHAMDTVTANSLAQDDPEIVTQFTTYALEAGLTPADMTIAINPAGGVSPPSANRKQNFPITVTVTYNLNNHLAFMPGAGEALLKEFNWGTYTAEQTATIEPET